MQRGSNCLGKGRPRSSGGRCRNRSERDRRNKLGTLVRDDLQTLPNVTTHTTANPVGHGVQAVPMRDGLKTVSYRFLSGAMMKTTILAAALTLSFAAPAVAQNTPPATLRLTVEDAVKMALDHNLELAAARLNPPISDTQVAEAAGA